MVWVLARKLKARELEGIKEDIITYRELMTLLGYSKTDKRALDLVLREAVALGVLNRAWKGNYRVIREGVDYVVTSTIPQSVGKRELHNEYLLKDWLEFIEAEEVEREFNSLVAWTRVYGSLYWQAWGLEPPAGNAGNTGFTPPTRKSKPAGAAKPAKLKPPQLRHFIITLLSVGHNLLEAVVMGNTYLLLLGLGGDSSGGGRYTFYCTRCRTPAGGARYLCAGSVKVLQELLATAGPNPICSIAGGDLAPTSLVADIPGRGLQLFDQAPATASKLEPGLQVYGTPLLPVVEHWYQLAVTSTYRNSIGVPALVLLPRSKVNRAVTRRPLRLLREVLYILDALAGAVHSALSQLPAVDSLSLSQLPRPLLRGTPPRLPLTDGGGGGTAAVYVEYQLKERVREVDRAGRQRVYWLHHRERLAPLSQFLWELNRYASSGIEVQIMNFKVIVPLVGADATGLSDTLNFGYLYIYHNQHKDPPGAVRIELRSHSGVKKAVGKYGLLDLFARSLVGLLPTLEATHRALAP
jgi:hypothetical protein